MERCEVLNARSRLAYCGMFHMYLYYVFWLHLSIIAVIVLLWHLQLGAGMLEPY